MPVLDTIMVIDDDPVTGLLVEKANHEVQLAKRVRCFYSAVDGLDYLTTATEQKKALPEVIFLDIRMPIVNGWQFLEQFNAMGQSETTIFMLTSSIDQSDMNRARKVPNVEDYIVKPLSVHRLKAIRDSVLNLSREVSSTLT